MINQPNIGPVLSPGYDMLNTTLVNSDDQEQLALSLNGKKNRIRKNDFLQAFTSAGLDKKQQDFIFNKMIDAKPQWMKFTQEKIP